MTQAIIGQAELTATGRRGVLNLSLEGRTQLIAFSFCLPLILIVACLVVYPAFFSLHLATLNKSMVRFVGIDNFRFLFSRELFWLVVEQSCIFAISAVVAKALIGFVVAHCVHNIPAKGQRKWRGMLLMPWVVPPAMSTLIWWWMYEPNYSALNWILTSVGLDRVQWLGFAGWARFSVILVNVWYGSPFFMIMYLAALKSVPAQLYEAAAIDGANAWQKLRYVTLPMMRNIIAITVLFSLIVTFANFDIVQILTGGGPRDLTHVFATWAFQLGIRANDIPLGASVSLFMFPILGISAILILRNVSRRGNQA
jgi:multiple sugar transport system permease protein